MLDDLRRAAQAREDARPKKKKEEKLFGMTAMERMFLSMALFGVVLVVSIIFLVITDSIAL